MGLLGSLGIERGISSDTLRLLLIALLLSIFLFT